MIEQGYKVWFNGSILHESEARISASSRAAAYGDGCFETLRSYSGKFISWDRHVERLHGGMRYLGIRMNQSLQNNTLKKSVIRLIQINRLDTIDVKIRIQVWRSGAPGISEPSKDEPLIIITARPAIIRDEPISLIFANTRRIPSQSISSKYKLSNYLNYILAGREAEERNADDAIMLTVSGKVSECSIANIFWMKGENVFTPSLLCDVLPGITRMLSIHFLTDNGKNVIEGEYTPDDITGSDAVWVCNSIREWQSVGSVENHTFHTGFPEYIRLRESFGSYIQLNLE
jgi:branched-subunit amino acid aminotransferase/4-amino-4-deoxychorismate lyase